MQKLEKVLEEIDLVKEEIVNLDCGGDYNAGLRDMAMMAKQIIRKYMNDDWISADEKPKKDLYLDIVYGLAKQYNVKMDEKELALKAEQFALRKSGRSARAARQLIEQLAALSKEDENA